MKLVNIRKQDKGCVVYSFSIQYEDGPIYADHKLMKKDSKYWVSGPSRQYEKDNEKKYFNFMSFEEDPKKWAFEKEVMKQLKESTQTSFGAPPYQAKPPSPPSQMEVPF